MMMITATVNYLWHRIVHYVRDRMMRFMNFMDLTLRNLVNDLLDYLKILFDSLRALIPEIEILFELIAVIKGAMLAPEVRFA